MHDMIFSVLISFPSDSNLLLSNIYVFITQTRLVWTLHAHLTNTFPDQELPF